MSLQRRPLRGQEKNTLKVVDPFWLVVFVAVSSQSSYWTKQAKRDKGDSRWSWEKSFVKIG